MPTAHSINSRRDTSHPGWPSDTAAFPPPGLLLRPVSYRNANYPVQLRGNQGGRSAFSNTRRYPRRHGADSESIDARSASAMRGLRRRTQRLTKLRRLAGASLQIQADVADRGAVAQMVVRTEAELGPVSILVNNAGVSAPATLESYGPVAITHMRRVNVDGVIHTIRCRTGHFAGALQRSPKGSCHPRRYPPVSTSWPPAEDYAF